MNKDIIKTAIVGTSGITASELVKILKNHPRVKIVYLLSTQEQLDIKKTFHIEGAIVLPTFDKNSFYQLTKDKVDIIFLCLPHKVSMQFVEQLIQNIGFEQLPKIIDLSADFRIKNIEVYEKFYQYKHLLPHIVERFVYGLPEMKPGYTKEIASSNFVANPGCYPTTVILGLAPIVQNYEFSEIIIDAKSGYSGGGKKLVEEYESYGGNNTYPYNVGGEHRHIPEIKEKLSLLAGKEVNFLFTPYVVPQYQGMLTTVYVKITNTNLQVIDLYEIYKDYYKNCVFIRILPLGTLVQTRNVIKTNYCDIAFSQEKSSRWVKIFVAIDNLVKGAVGQAVQNMNIMFGFEETLGLM